MQRGDHGWAKGETRRLIQSLESSYPRKGKWCLELERWQTRWEKVIQLWVCFVDKPNGNWMLEVRGIQERCLGFWTEPLGGWWHYQ